MIAPFLTRCRPFLRLRQLVLALAVAGALAAHGHATEPDIDTAIILDAGAGTNKRTLALDRLWAAAESGQTDRSAARETCKQVLWKSSAPAGLREAALNKLFADTSADGKADNRKLLRLRLPTESQWPLIVAMCSQIEREAGDLAWREVGPALVRSFARAVPTPPDPDRPEQAALLALHSGRSIEQIAFDVYLRPAGEADLPGQSADIVEKQRLAAWDLLGRLDPDGAKRREMLAAAPAGDPALRPLERAATELRIVPVTGSELAWVKGLIDSKDPGASEWWAAAQTAVSRLTPEQSKGLQLRHIEPLRWASVHKSEWLADERSALMSELASRLEPRRKWRKSEGLGPDELMSRELLTDWDDRLVWGDVLTILVVDEALKDRRVVDSLFKQAAADRADTSTEYGGALFSTDAVPLAPLSGGKNKPRWDITGDPGFIVRGYSARPAQRVNDRTFTAPEELFEAEGAGGRALAHFHFHVQSVNNAEYAGPGKGDFDYAAMHGRTCLVFTSVRNGVLNADYYQRNAARQEDGKGGNVGIDLGEVSDDR